MKTLAALVLAAAATSALAVMAVDRAPSPANYVEASDAEIEAIFAEAAASGLVVQCEAADTSSGCKR
ncbi:MAG: hypothetical protein IT383_01350 [Deltaproteobacteria bacterium]|nr:hypothetical protein [Deltaproteobacteria bacterium]